MTLDAVRPSVLWAGDGVTTSFPLSSSGVAISYQDSSHIKVRQLIVATGVSSLLEEGVDYSFDLATVERGATTPANITRIAGALTSGYVWAIYREQPYAQDTNLPSSGELSTADIEAGLDRSREIDQEQEYLSARSILLSYFDDPDDIDMVLPPLSGNANKVLTLNEDEDGFEFSALLDVTLDIGTVTTLAAGSEATVTLNDLGDGEFTLDFGIPTGAQGASGSGSGDMVRAQNLSDVANTSTAFNNIKQTATTSATGVVELATDAEASGGTTNDTTRYITTDHLHKARADVASAASINLGAAASNFVRITGTTNITTSFGTAAAGVWRHVVMEGALTITHTGGAILLPGAANITTAANDAFLARSLGSGNWIVLMYQKASGAPLIVANAAQTAQGTNTTLPVVPAQLFQARADIASASTTNIASNSTMYIRITGTTQINLFDSGINSGLRRFVVMQGALTLKNSANIILPGGADIVTAAGDTFEIMSEGSQIWRVLWYSKASGLSVISSGLVGIVTRGYSEYTSNADLTGIIPYDDTIPQVSEGSATVSVTMTVASASNRIRIHVSGFAVTNAPRILCALFRTGATDAVAAWVVDGVGTGQQKAIDHTFEYAPGVSGSQTWSMRVGTELAAGGIVRMNGTMTGRLFGGKAGVRMAVEEIVP